MNLNIGMEELCNSNMVELRSSSSTFVENQSKFLCVDLQREWEHKRKIRKQMIFI